jgi:hypothetical protein
MGTLRKFLRTHVGLFLRIEEGSASCRACGIISRESEMVGDKKTGLYCNSQELENHAHSHEW